ncbi:hypothetical protein OPU71_11470 [Niveibacterium sp. 24ML]|uniref:hypothetical protein n=1 Tax=Niveibacterium sp. 24ML TaxID=2985512 RepID=UPI00226EB14F|nr:hypothetical protein [Niveibacterium sp. 24ML]MCX9156744.1 hypothetical protein [Niveibacterium sp. 24ML]
MQHVSRRVALVLLLLVSGNGVAHAQWVFAAKKAVGVVRQLASEASEGRETGYDSATVMLAAHPEDVYRKAVSVVKASAEYRLTRQNDEALTLEISDGTWLAGMQVTPVDEKLSQLLIVSNSAASAKSGSSVAVRGVLRVCREMQVECQVAAPPAASK